MAAAEASCVVSVLLEFFGRVAYGYAESDVLDDGPVRQVVAQVADLFEREFQLLADRADDWQLLLDTP